MDMTPFFAEHGLLLVVGVVLIERLAVPLPAMPVLFFAGAKTAEAPFFGLIALALAILAYKPVIRPVYFRQSVAALWGRK
jgi:membrane protein DedA with SNARE-associated domain